MKGLAKRLGFEYLRGTAQFSPVAKPWAPTKASRGFFVWAVPGRRLKPLAPLPNSLEANLTRWPKITLGDKTGYRELVWFFPLRGFPRRTI